MSDAVLIAYSSPVDAASESAWLEWFHSVHIPELRAAIPEMTDIVQYRVLRPEGTTPRFVTRYDVPGLDAPTLAGKLGAAGPTLSQTDLMGTGDDATVIEFATAL